MKKMLFKHKKQFTIITIMFEMLICSMMIVNKSYSQNIIRINNNLVTTSQNNNNSKPKACGSYIIDTAAMTQALYFESHNSNNLLTLSYSIRVYFHICRNTNGTNAATNETVIADEFSTLVADYSINNICFINMGLNYIDNTTINTNPTAALLNPYLIPGCLNIFYHADMTGCGCGGSAYTIPSTFCSVHKNNIGWSRTISHEVGHCLGLLHTFETFYGYEKIDGSNSTTKGDKISDTPADPYSYYGQSCFTTNACCYTGNCTDPNGQSNFTVPYTNVMAYWWAKGYANLVITGGQYTRANSFLNTNAGLQACESPANLTVGPVNYSSGYNMLSAINTLNTNGNVNITGSTFTTFGGYLVLLEPGFVASPTGGLILIRPSDCGTAIPRISNETSSVLSSQTGLYNLKCYPNPFTDKINVAFDLAIDHDVTIKLFNVMGKEMYTISKSFFTNGHHELTADVSRLEGGIYFVTIKCGDFRSEQKIIKVN